MIEIQNIRTNNIDDIINLLLDKDEQPFEIYVPKSTQLYSSTSEDIANDYAMLAYAGQKLSEVADEFSYDYVSPSNHESVLFEIKTNNLKRLAETILNISYGYDNEHDDEELYYLDDVYDFITKVTTKEILPVCPDFIEDWQEYNNVDEIEDGDE